MHRVRHPITMFVLAVLAIIGIGVGVVSGLPTASSFHSRTVSFSYPASWQVSRAQCGDSQVSQVVELATEPLPSPAPTTSTTIPPGEQVVAYSCGFSVKTLKPEGIDIVVESWPGVVGGYARAPGGTHLTIDGRPARLAITTTIPECKLIGGSKVMQATVAASAKRAFQVFACLRGPRFSAPEHLFATMVRTMRFPASS